MEFMRPVWGNRSLFFVRTALITLAALVLAIWAVAAPRVLSPSPPSSSATPEASAPKPVKVPLGSFSAVRPSISNHSSSSKNVSGSYSSGVAAVETRVTGRTTSGESTSSSLGRAKAANKPKRSRHVSGSGSKTPPASTTPTAPPPTTTNTTATTPAVAPVAMPVVVPVTAPTSAGPAHPLHSAPSGERSKAPKVPKGPAPHYPNGNNSGHQHDFGQIRQPTSESGPVAAGPTSPSPPPRSHQPPQGNQRGSGNPTWTAHDGGGHGHPGNGHHSWPPAR